MTLNTRQMAAYASTPAKASRKPGDKPKPSWDTSASAEAMLGRFTLALVPFSLLVWMFVAG